MSKVELKDIKCCKCGHPNKALIVYSYFHRAYGHSNYYLSLRNIRNYPMKDPMIVRECPNCGYINPDLSEDNGISMNFIKQLTDEFPFKSEYCNLFYKYYIMLMMLGKYSNAYKILIDSLEECDYLGDTQGALFCMMKMIKVYDMLESHNDNQKMIHLDSLRRLGLFSKTKAFAKEIVFSDVYLGDNIVSDVLKYQIYLADNYKDGLYTIKDMREWLDS